MRPHARRLHRMTPEIPFKTAEPVAEVEALPVEKSRLILMPDGLTRRTVLKAGGVAVAAGILGLTPTIVDADELTPSLTEGPYFKPNSPLRTNLRTDGVTGVFLDLTGTVTDTNGVAVANALLDFWHADMNGNYSTGANSDPNALTGYELRGHQYTDAQGAYALQTIVPGHYVGRTLHIHVKAQAPNATILTTQLFFPNGTTFYGLNLTQLNAADGIYNAACVIALTDASAQAGFPYVTGRFQFVVPTTALPGTGSGTGTGTGTGTRTRRTRTAPTRTARARRR